MTALVEQGIPGGLMFIWLSLWTVYALFRLRSLQAKHGDADLTTLAATAGAVLGSVFIAGNTADFLMAEVQFWVFAVFVTLLQLGQHAVANPGPRKAFGHGARPTAMADGPSQVISR
jgi:cation transport ATPase